MAKKNKLILSLVLVHFDPKLVPQKSFCGLYLYLMVYIVASCHCMQFQGKLMNQTWKNGKKPSFGPDFDPFGTNDFFMDFSFTTC